MVRDAWHAEPITWRERMNEEHIACTRHPKWGPTSEASPAQRHKKDLLLTGAPVKKVSVDLRLPCGTPPQLRQA